MCPPLTILNYTPFLADGSRDVTDDVYRIAGGNLSEGMSLCRNNRTYGLQLLSQFRVILDRTVYSFLLKKGSNYQQTFSLLKFSDLRAILVNEFSWC